MYRRKQLPGSTAATSAAAVRCCCSGCSCLLLPSERESFSSAAPPRRRRVKTTRRRGRTKRINLAPVFNGGPSWRPAPRIGKDPGCSLVSLRCRCGGCGGDDDDEARAAPQSAPFAASCRGYHVTTEEGSRDDAVAAITDRGRSEQPHLQRRVTAWLHFLRGMTPEARASSSAHCTHSQHFVLGLSTQHETSWVRFKPRPHNILTRCILKITNFLSGV